MDKLLTNEEIAAIIKNYTGKENVQIKNIDIKPLSDTAEGLLGEHFKITINYDDGSGNDPEAAKLFLKQLSKREGCMFEMALSIRAYDKEQFVYSHFLEECKKHPVIDTSFAPKGYYSDCSKFKVVLEDLSVKGFRTAPKKGTLDLEHSKRAMEALAKFHGASIICEEIVSKETGTKFSFVDKHEKDLEEVLFSKKETLGTKWFKCSLDGINCIIDALPEEGVPKEKFKEKMKEAVENLYELMKPSSKWRNSITHGDLWTNNFMFRYENDQPMECILIDFQLVKYSPPSLDVVQLILTNTRRSLRDNHWRELLDHYYTQLTSVLEGADLDIAQIIPYDDYLTSCYVFKIPAKLQAIADRSVTYLSSESLAEAISSSQTFSEFLFEDRSKSMLQNFLHNEEFKEIVGEDVLELRDLLMNYTK